jgi:hypothetical protein
MPKPKVEGYTLFGHEQPHHADSDGWEPTPNLQWLAPNAHTPNRVLQQLWRNQQGRTQWRDVETVFEP